MLCFDIGANRGDFTKAALDKGYEVIALEPAPRVYAELVKAFIYDRRVLCLRNAVSDSNESRVDFYECVEDGLSTLNKDWLTDPSMPYHGKQFQTIEVMTLTVDYLTHTYGEPDLIKIDVEGAEWNVLRGMTRKYGMVALEWTFETMLEHEKQMDYMYQLGYREVAAQYIEHHLSVPQAWGKLTEDNSHQLLIWHQTTSDAWIDGEWQKSGLRPTADVGMLWFR